MAVVFSVLLLVPAVAQDAFAHGNIDQSNIGPIYPVNALNPTTTNTGQVFTPTVSQLDAIDIQVIAPFLTGPQQFTVNVHQGNAFGGPIISSAGSATFPAIPVCQSLCVIHIDLTTPIPLTPGSQHILQINQQSGLMNWNTASADTYPGGFRITVNVNQVFDFVFTTYSLPVVVGGSLIPIDTTALLLASTQSFSWMIPVLLSGIGIGLFVVGRKNE